MNYYSKKYIETESASIHVNLFQNTIEGHFSSPEHHTKAFGTLLSAGCTDCHYVFQKPFLALHEGKNKTEKVTSSVLSYHFMLSTKTQNWFW